MEVRISKPRQGSSKLLQKVNFVFVLRAMGRGRGLMCSAVFCLDGVKRLLAKMEDILELNQPQHFIITTREYNGGFLAQKYFND
jgi:hypothetical protein